jgi:hypothetical protein
MIKTANAKDRNFADGLAEGRQFLDLGWVFAKPLRDSRRNDVRAC